MDDNEFEDSLKSGIGKRTASIKKGRFVVESAFSDDTAKRGRFRISNMENRLVFELIEKQNEQIEILFDIVKNLTGTERLFQKEFMECSAVIEEKINELRKSLRDV